MDKIGEIILVILTSVGGISGIIIIAVKFCSNIIAKRLEEKYSLKLSKELELFKSNIENKIYISRTKFDTEFQIYRDLSKAFFEAVKNVSIMIPSGVAIYPADKEEKRKYEEKLYKLAKESTVKAQDVLHSNAPFISTELFDEFDNILVICRQQLGVFEERWNVYNFSTQEEKESFSREDYKRTDELNDSFESAIDLLSYATMEKLDGKNWRETHLLSLAGVYRPAQKLEESKIPSTLVRFLKEYPHVQTIVFHLDNDRAGRLSV